MHAAASSPRSSVPVVVAAPFASSSQRRGRVAVRGARSWPATRTRAGAVVVVVETRHRRMRRGAPGLLRRVLASPPPSPRCAAASSSVVARGIRFNMSGLGGGAAPSGPGVDGPSVLTLGDRADHSWVWQLREDPDAPKHDPNKSSRQVFSGHYVRVAPTPLRKPRLALVSPDMLEELGIDEEDAKSEVRSI
jgi:hypothetical protein